MFDEELGRLRVPIVADLEGLYTGEREAYRRMHHLEQRTKPIGERLMRNLFPKSIILGIFQGVGQSLYSTLASTLTLPFRTFWDSIAASSERAGIDRKFKAVFAELEGDAAKWSRSFAHEIGRAVVDVKNIMSRFQDTLVPVGFDRSMATATSKTLSRLSTDLSASENITQTEAADRIVSGMVGNHEALRRFGVIITENSLKAQLMKMGIEGGTKAATEQQKVIARLNILLEGTRDAQGTAARAAGAFAMESQALHGVVQGLAASFGDVFTPSLARGSKFLREMISDANVAMGDTATLGESLARSFENVLDRLEPLRNDAIAIFEGIWKNTERLMSNIADELKDFKSFDQVWEDLKPHLVSGARGLGTEIGDAMGTSLGKAMQRKTVEAVVELHKWTPKQLLSRFAGEIIDKNGRLAGRAVARLMVPDMDTTSPIRPEQPMEQVPPQLTAAIKSGLSQGLTGWNDFRKNMADRGVSMAQRNVQQAGDRLAESRLAGEDMASVRQRLQDLRRAEASLAAAQRRSQSLAGGGGGVYDLLSAPDAGGVFGNSFSDFSDDVDSYSDALKRGYKAINGWAASAERNAMLHLKQADKTSAVRFDFMSPEQVQRSIQQGLSKDREEIRRHEEQVAAVESVRKAVDTQVGVLQQVPRKIGEAIGNFVGFQD